MIRLFLISMLFSFGLYDKNLKDCLDEVLDNSVVVVLDEVSCGSCFTTLMNISHIWRKDLSTSVVFKGVKDKLDTRRKTVFTRDFKQIDNIFFYERNLSDKHPQYSFGDMTLNISPNVLIYKNGKRKLITYEKLFPKNFDSNSVKKVMIKALGDGQ